MAANTSPIFTLTPNSGAQSQVSAACTSRTTITNQSDLCVAGSAGTLVSRLLFKAAASNSAGLIFVWLYDGSTYRLFEEIATPATSPSGTVPAANVQSALVTPQTPFALKTGWKFVFTTYLAETWNGFADSGDY